MCSTITGSISTRSPTCSSKRSLIKAGTIGATIGGSHSSTAADPYPWEEAVERFRDATGQPGPATWKSGTYPDGQADFPVGGVSWYEAAAYAAFAGKSLPTLHHWYRAAGLSRFGDILTVSNFSGKGPARVGSYNGLGSFGTYDMAGNVKEWCWTETNRGRFLARRRVERDQGHVRDLRCKGAVRTGA